MGVFPRSPDKPKKTPRAPVGTDPMQGDETNPMESPVMRTTEQIGEMEREARENKLKSKPFGAAWALLKERTPSSFDAPQKTSRKRHPSTSYGKKTPAMTRKPSGATRTGGVYGFGQPAPGAPGASQEDKAADRLAYADAMHGEDIQSIFEEQGIPVTSKVGEDIERNIDKPRPELEDDDKWYSAISRLRAN